MSRKNEIGIKNNPDTLDVQNGNAAPGIEAIDKFRKEFNVILP
jgi:hypothetical protein